MLIDYLKEDEKYLIHLNELDKLSLDSLEYKISKIFPVCKDIDFFNSSFSERFTGDIFQANVFKSLNEACLFMKNNRLSEVAGAVHDKEVRQKIIKSNLEKVYIYFESLGFAIDKKYKSFWHYGSYSRA